MSASTLTAEGPGRLLCSAEARELLGSPPQLELGSATDLSAAPHFEPDARAWVGAPDGARALNHLHALASLRFLLEASDAHRWHAFVSCLPTSRPSPAATPATALPPRGGPRHAARSGLGLGSPARPN